MQINLNKVLQTKSKTSNPKNSNSMLCYKKPQPSRRVIISTNNYESDDDELPPQKTTSNQRWENSWDKVASVIDVNITHTKDSDVIEYPEKLVNEYVNLQQAPIDIKQQEMSNMAQQINNQQKSEETTQISKKNSPYKQKNQKSYIPYKDKIYKNSQVIYVVKN